MADAEKEVFAHAARFQIVGDGVDGLRERARHLHLLETRAVVGLLHDGERLHEVGERGRERREAPAAAQVVEILGDEVGVRGGDLGVQRLEDGRRVELLPGQLHRRAGQHPMGHAQRARVHHLHALGMTRLLDQAARHLVGTRQAVGHGEVDHLVVGIVGRERERRRRRRALRQRARAHLRQELLGRDVLVFEPGLAVDGHDERQHGHAAPRTIFHGEHDGRISDDLHGNLFLSPAGRRARGCGSVVTARRRCVHHAR